MQTKFCLLFIVLFLTTVKSKEDDEEIVEDDDTKRIVNGTVAKHGQFAYIVPMFLYKNPYGTISAQICAACILNEKWLLTAAHCLDGKTPSQIHFQTGIVDFVADVGQKLYAEEFYRHPKFDIENYSEWDIALIKLLNSANFNNRVGTCSLPEPDSEPLDKEVTIMGWGRLDPERTKPTKDLHSAKIRLSSQKICENEVDGYNDKLLCVVYRNKTNIGVESGTCVGDSGGPIIQEQHGRSVVVGIVSNTIGYCARGQSVFTKVSKYVESFIKPIMNREKPVV